MLPDGFYETADSVQKNGTRVGRRLRRSDGELREHSRTYDLESMNDGNACRIIEEREAMKQAVLKILNTERYVYPIYSNGYGVETADLFGLDCDYVCVELERRISEALLTDRRITSVDGFSFNVGKNVIYAEFNAETVFGNFKSTFINHAINERE